MKKDKNCINWRPKELPCRNGSQCGNTNAERDVGKEGKVTIARWHDATDLELERFETRGGTLKERPCRRKTERISFSKDVQVVNLGTEH